MDRYGMKLADDTMGLRELGAEFVVAVDFGTTFSGFAYSRRGESRGVRELDNVKLYDDLWEGAQEANAASYCKTQTSLYYTKEAGVWQFKNWGWAAFADYSRDTRNQAKMNSGGALVQRCLLTRFKLHLAGEVNKRSSTSGQAPEPLPEGLDLDKVISDYLRAFSNFIINHLKKEYKLQVLTSEQIQWCLTVPAIWDDVAKQQMKIFAQKAGMVIGRFTPSNAKASPHKLQICLEPEAASFYCVKYSKTLRLTKGDQYMIADIGGGTTDIVVHEKTSADDEDVKVKEVVSSYGGLCGGTDVDFHFFKFVKEKIGCYESFCRGNYDVDLKIRKIWEDSKRSYNGTLTSSLSIRVDKKLQIAWKEHDKRLSAVRPESHYEELVIRNEDMLRIMNPVVEEVIKLIRKELSGRKLKVLMVVGGFSASPYLRVRINEAFSSLVQTIINPPDPGAAICHGAVTMVSHPFHPIVSRKSRKTYGLSITRRAAPDDPPEKRFRDNEGIQVKGAFSAYTFVGTEIDVNHKVSKLFRPASDDQEKIKIQIYSSSNEYDPEFVDEEGVELEKAVHIMDISDARRQGVHDPVVEVTMAFGLSSIEVEGKRVNFGDRTKSEVFAVEIL